jgi:hypothetical protein
MACMMMASRRASAIRAFRMATSRDRRKRSGSSMTADDLSN